MYVAIRGHSEEWQFFKSLKIVNIQGQLTDRIDTLSNKLYMYYLKS